MCAIARPQRSEAEILKHSEEVGNVEAQPGKLACLVAIVRDLSADAAQLLHACSVLVYTRGTQHFHE